MRRTIALSVLFLLFGCASIQARPDISGKQIVNLKNQLYHVPESMPKDFPSWDEVCLGEVSFNDQGNRIEGHLHGFFRDDGERKQIVFVLWIIKDNIARVFAIFYKANDTNMVTIDYDGDTVFETVRQNIEGENL